MGSSRNIAAYSWPGRILQGAVQAFFLPSGMQNRLPHSRLTAAICTNLPPIKLAKLPLPIAHDAVNSNSQTPANICLSSPAAAAAAAAAAFLSGNLVNYGGSVDVNLWMSQVPAPGQQYVTGTKSDGSPQYMVYDPNGESTRGLPQPRYGELKNFGYVPKPGQVSVEGLVRSHRSVPLERM